MIERIVEESVDKSTRPLIPCIRDMSIFSRCHGVASDAKSYLRHIEIANSTGQLRSDSVRDDPVCTHVRVRSLAWAKLTAQISENASPQNTLVERNRTIY
jgi:hypothetical protein